MNRWLNSMPICGESPIGTCRGSARIIRSNPAALVNEAYLRLIGQENLKYASRSHFLAAAAETMRRVLVEHARAKKSKKRGGDWKPTAFDGIDLQVQDRQVNQLDVMWLDEALQKLAGQNQRMCDVVIGRSFAGMTVEEVAESMGISPRTVAAEWAKGKEWLTNELNR